MPGLASQQSYGYRRHLVIKTLISSARAHWVPVRLTAFSTIISQQKNKPYVRLLRQQGLSRDETFRNGAHQVCHSATCHLARLALCPEFSDAHCWQRATADCTTHWLDRGRQCGCLTVTRSTRLWPSQLLSTDYDPTRHELLYLARRASWSQCADS